MSSDAKSDRAPLQSLLLESFLQQELAAGNEIAADGPPLGSLRRLILLAGPFRTEIPISEPLRRNEINDPHWWQSEVIDSSTQEMIACRGKPISPAIKSITTTP